MSDAEFDRYADNYDRVLGDSLSNAAGDSERFAEYKVGEMALQVGNSAQRKILDFGCGVGRSLKFLERYFPGASLAGYDPSSASIAEARKRSPGALFFDDAAALPSQGFDLVLAANVMHHVPVSERAGATALCARLLAPGGSLFVFEHNPYNPVTRRVFDRCPFDRDASMIPRRDLIALGEAAGLRVVRAAYTLFLPFASRPWLRAQRLLSLVPAGAQYYVQFAR